MKSKNNWLDESVVTFKKIDKIVSKIFLYYSSTCGFIFGWVCLGILFFSISGEIPGSFVILLRVFYFLVSFLFGLKLTLVVIGVFRKKKLD